MIVDLQGHGHLPFDALFPIYPGRSHQTSPARDPGISTCRPTWRNRGHSQKKGETPLLSFARYFARKCGRENCLKRGFSLQHDERVSL